MSNSDDDLVFISSTSLNDSKDPIGLVGKGRRSSRLRRTSQRPERKVVFSESDSDDDSDGRKKQKKPTRKIKLNATRSTAGTKRTRKRGASKTLSKQSAPVLVNVSENDSNANDGTEDEENVPSRYKRTRVRQINYKEPKIGDSDEEKSEDDEEYEEGDSSGGQHEKNASAGQQSGSNDEDDEGDEDEEEEEESQENSEKGEDDKEEKSIASIMKSMHGSQQDLDEEKKFNELDDQHKLQRLQQLVEKSKIFSQIIADTLLESTLQKKKKEKEEEDERQRAAEENTRQLEEQGLDPDREMEKLELEDEDAQNEQIIAPARRRRRNKKAKKNDFLSIYNESKNKEISQETMKTKLKLENAQSSSTRGQPKLVTGAVMRDYQLEGLEWLATLYENGLNGILADEMGLGKTLQSISLLAFLYEHGNKGPFLIACPLSTVGNWIKEIEKFTPSIPHLRYSGTKEHREEIRRKHFAKNKRSKVGIVVTNYECIIRDIRYLNKFKWKFLIVDEGHRLKNINSKLIKELKRLDTTNRLLLTGTPLQNNLDELWSLLNFILPDIFQDIELFHQWFDFSTFGNEENSDVINAEIQKSLIENLHTILKPFLLRRLKKTVVKNLPPKREYIVYNSLTPLQTDLYHAALNRNLKKVLVQKAFYDYVSANRLDKYYSKETLDNFYRMKVNAFAARSNFTDVAEVDGIQVVDGDVQGMDPNMKGRLRGKRQRRVNYRELGFQEFEGDLSYSDEDGSATSQSDHDFLSDPEITILAKYKNKKRAKKGKKRADGSLGKAANDSAVEKPDANPGLIYENGIIKGILFSALAENERNKRSKKRHEDISKSLLETQIENTQPDIIEQMKKINQKNQSDPFLDILSDLHIENKDQMQFKNKIQNDFTPLNADNANGYVTGGVVMNADAKKSKKSNRSKAKSKSLDWVNIDLSRFHYSRDAFRVALTPDAKGVLPPAFEFPKMQPLPHQIYEMTPEDYNLNLKRFGEYSERVGRNPDDAYSKNLLENCRMKLTHSQRFATSVVRYNSDLAADYGLYIALHREIEAKLKKSCVVVNFQLGKGENGQSAATNEQQAELGTNQAEENDTSNVSNGDKAIEATNEILSRSVKAANEHTPKKRLVKGKEVDVFGLSDEDQESSKFALSESKPEINGVPKESENADFKPKEKGDIEKANGNNASDAVKNENKVENGAKGEVKDEVKVEETQAKDDIKEEVKMDTNDAKDKIKDETKSEVEGGNADKVGDDDKTIGSNEDDVHDKVENKSMGEAKVKDGTSKGTTNYIDSESKNKPDSDFEDKPDSEKQDVAVKEAGQVPIEEEDKDKKEEEKGKGLADKKEISIVAEVDEGIDITNEDYSNEKVISLQQVWSHVNKEIDAKPLRNMMMQLRLICDSPYLFYFPWEADSDFDDRLIQNSGKMQVLDQLVDQLLVKEAGQRHKILIFSQFTKMLDLIEDWAYYKNIKCCRIDGSTGQDIREDEILNFNDNEEYKIFLLSTRAGGLGINLVSADTVILFDSDWNPQVDLQAMDRVHRLGQMKPVIVYRFATANTAEQILLSRADSKRKLEKVVIQMGKFESLKKLVGENKTANVKVKSDVARELRKLLKENTFVGGDIKDNTLSEEELKELLDRNDNAYKKSSCVMNHLELFETTTNELENATDNVVGVSEETAKIMEAEEVNSSDEDTVAELAAENNSVALEEMTKDVGSDTEMLA